MRTLEQQAISKIVLNRLRELNIYHICLTCNLADAVRSLHHAPLLDCFIVEDNRSKKSIALGHLNEPKKLKDISNVDYKSRFKPRLRGLNMLQAIAMLIDGDQAPAVLTAEFELFAQSADVRIDSARGNRGT